jgi:hypothetical protein
VLAIAPTKSQLVLKMEKLNLDVMPSKDSELITTQVVQPMTVDRIEEVQEGNPRHAKLKAKANKGETPPFWVTRGGLLRKSITSETR